MKLKTKFDKHANDDEKRRKALNEKAKVKSNQSEIIKQALSTATLHNGLSKKIVFDDDDDDIDGKTNGKSKSNPLLFDRFSDDDENQNFEIKEKAQFGGKKGFEASIHYLNTLKLFLSCSSIMNT